MTNNDFFIYATRNKLRFISTRGEVSTEQLWDIPLLSSDGFNLNEIAKAVNKAWKSATEENFVETLKTAAHIKLEMSLEVVKSVIDIKLTEQADAKKRAENKIEKEKLLAILAEKQDGKLSALSEAELKRRIAALE